MFRLGLLLVSYVFNDLCCAPVCPLVTFCPLFAKYIYIFNTPVIYVYTFCPQEENLLSFSPWDYKKKIFLSFSLWDHEKKIFLSFSPWDHEIIYLTTWCSWWNLPVLELHGSTAKAWLPTQGFWHNFLRTHKAGMPGQVLVGWRQHTHTVIAHHCF